MKQTPECPSAMADCYVYLDDTANANQWCCTLHGPFKKLKGGTVAQ